MSKHLTLLRFLSSGSVLVQLLFLTFFPLKPCSTHFSSDSTIADGVKHEGRLVAVSVMRVRTSLPVVKRDVAVSLQFQELRAGKHQPPAAITVALPTVPLQLVPSRPSE